jgi:CRP/FNR family transcriptional regulator
MHRHPSCELDRLPAQIAAPAGKVRCGLCCMRDFCAPEGLERSEIEFLKTFVRQQELALAKGDQLYRQGDPFHALFAVHTGSFKLVMTSADGRERVTGFAFAGDLIGLAAIATGRHGDRAVALEKGGACLLPWARIEEAAAHMAIVRRQMMRMLSREIRRGDEQRLLVGQLPAEARFAAFLVGLSVRMADRGFDDARLRLPMSRPDIADFLGLSAETVSRLFTRFRDQGLIRARGRHVELARPDALEALSRRRNVIRTQN